MHRISNRGCRRGAPDLPLDLLLPVISSALYDGATGALDPHVAVDRVLSTLRTADLSAVTARCLRCGNGAAFDLAEGTVVCGVGCGQPPAGQAHEALRRQLTENLTRLASSPQSAGLSTHVVCCSHGIVGQFAAARLIDGDTKARER